MDAVEYQRLLLTIQYIENKRKNEIKELINNNIELQSNNWDEKGKAIRLLFPSDWEECKKKDIAELYN